MNTETTLQATRPVPFRAIIAAVLSVLLAGALLPAFAPPARAADSYPWQIDNSFGWEKERNWSRNVSAEDRAYLADNGIGCNGGVCEPNGNLIPQTLDLSGRNLKGLTFRNLTVTNIRSDDANLNDTRWEVTVTGKWDASRMTAKNIEIAGKAGAEAFKPASELKGKWSASNLEGMKISQTRLENLELQTVKARGAEVTKSVINQKSLQALVDGGTRELPGNAISATGARYTDEGRQALLEPGGVHDPKVYEGLNLAGSRVRGDLVDVDLRKANLNDVTWESGRWENVSITKGSMLNTTLKLYSAEKLRLTPEKVGSLSLRSEAGIADAALSGTGRNIKIEGPTTKLDLDKLKPGSGEGRFLDLSGGVHDGISLPVNANDSVLGRATYKNTVLPREFSAQRSDLSDIRFAAKNGNSIDARPNFSGSTADNADFSGQVFTDANFSRVTSQGMNAENATFVGETRMDGGVFKGFNGLGSTVRAGEVSWYKAIWESIKAIFGFRPSGGISMAGTTLRGISSLDAWSTEMIDKISWDHVGFAGGTELVFSSKEKAEQAGRAIDRATGVTGKENLTISYRDAAGTARPLVAHADSAAITERLDLVSAAQDKFDAAEAKLEALKTARDKTAATEAKAQAEYAKAEAALTDLTKQDRAASDKVHDLLDRQFELVQANADDEVAARKAVEAINRNLPLEENRYESLVKQKAKVLEDYFADSENKKRADDLTEKINKSDALIRKMYDDLANAERMIETVLPKRHERELVNLVTKIENAKAESNALSKALVEARAEFSEVRKNLIHAKDNLSKAVESVNAAQTEFDAARSSRNETLGKYSKDSLDKQKQEQRKQQDIQLEQQRQEELRKQQEIQKRLAEEQKALEARRLAEQRAKELQQQRQIERQKQDLELQRILREQAERQKAQLKK